MAEIAVKVATNHLIPLLSHLSQEVTFLRGVEHEVGSIIGELELIQAYLRDADMKAEIADAASSTVAVWVKQMRGVAHRIEDAIDEYYLKVTEIPECSGLFGILCTVGHLIRTIIAHHEVSSEIGKIRKSIDDLAKDKVTSEFSKSAQESRSNGTNTYAGHDVVDLLNIDQAQLVGIERSRKQLTEYLSTGDKRRTVVAVVGEGGIGKTAVVRNVYHEQKEERSFDCYAWITVSPSLKGDMLLRTIMWRFYEEDGNEFASKGIESMDTSSLVRRLGEYLKGKRYLIVFDGVSEINFWEGVRFTLPKDKNSSRIMLTTRNIDVADACKASDLVRSHEMTSLDEVDALKLLHQKVFQFDPEGCPKELMDLSLDFVLKCERVPLAIEAISGLLLTKERDVHTWKGVLDSIGSKLRSDPRLRSFFLVLSESYYDLSYHLKLCLLYFGLFPEGYSIKCARLIRLWVAEGIVEEDQNENRTLEEVAEEYLAELFRRSLVKISQVDFNGKPRNCRVHDLMHGFLLRKCEELNFCRVIKSLRSSFSSSARRLSIHRDNQDAAPGKAANFGRVRFCLVFDLEKSSRPLDILFFSNFKLLTGLDLEDSSLDRLPEQIGKMLHLKYLSLRNTNIKELPRSIANLEKLQTLDLKHTQVRELSFEIKRLIKLRHLKAYCLDWTIGFCVNTLQGVKLREGVGSLTSLQKLSFVDTTESLTIIEELESLKQLRKLGILKLKEQYGAALCAAIENMIHLRSLSIAATEDNTNLQLQSLTDPPMYLERLYLKGRLESLPRWISRLQNLTRLRLNWSGLREDPLPFLKDLSSLLELGLYNAYKGDELHFKEGWFKKLKVLSLQNIDGLKNIRIGNGALPVLEKHTISGISQMVDIPADLQKLKQLKELHLFKMPDQLIYRLLQQDGKSYGIVRGIPFVLIDHDNHFFSLHHLLALKNEFLDEDYKLTTQSLFE